MNTRRNAAGPAGPAAAPPVPRYIALVPLSVKVREAPITVEALLDPAIDNGGTTHHGPLRKRIWLEPVAGPGDPCDRVPEASIPHLLAHDPQQVVSADVWDALTSDERACLIGLTRRNIPYRPASWAAMTDDQRVQTMQFARADLAHVTAAHPEFGFLVRVGLIPSEA